jgi:hypothetical protein
MRQISIRVADRTIATWTQVNFFFPNDKQWQSLSSLLPPLLVILNRVMCTIGMNSMSFEITPLFVLTMDENNMATLRTYEIGATLTPVR